MDRVGHQQRARRRAGNDQQLRRLQQHHDMALLHQEAANHRREDQTDAYDCEHGCLPGANVTWIAARMRASQHRALARAPAIRASVSSRSAQRRAHAHGQRYAIAPPAEIRRPRQSRQRLCVAVPAPRSRLSCDSTRNSSSPQRPTSSPGRSPLARVRSTVSSIVSHGPRPVGLAQFARLVHRHPQHRQRDALVEEHLEFDLPAGPPAPPGSVEPPPRRSFLRGAGQSVVRRDEKPPPCRFVRPARRAESFSVPCAGTSWPSLMLRVHQRSASGLRTVARLGVHIAVAAQRQWFQRLRQPASNQLRAASTPSSSPPRGSRTPPARPVQQRQPFRIHVQRRFDQFGTIRHAKPLSDLSAAGSAQLDWLG